MTPTPTAAPISAANAPKTHGSFIPARQEAAPISDANAPKTTPLVALKQASFYAGARPIVTDVSVDIHPREMVMLIGPNGGGKTTVLRMLLGLLKPSRGQAQQQARLRIGYTPQKLHLAASFPITVERFLRLSHKGWHSKQALCNAIATPLEECGALHLLHKRMQALSSGETQRVLLARALMAQPQLLALDEPLQGVDINGQVALHQLIVDIRNHRQCSVVLISHDLHMVMASTDRVYCLNGHVCCSGEPHHVIETPAYAKLFGTKPTPHLATYIHHHTHSHHP